MSDRIAEEVTPTPDLPIPDAALHELASCRDDNRHEPDAGCVRCVAIPVVVAVLHAAADRLDREKAETPWGSAEHNAVRADTLAEVARGLRARAGELEEGGR